jgi:hypothetical protein
MHGNKEICIARSVIVVDSTLSLAHLIHFSTSMYKFGLFNFMDGPSNLIFSKLKNNAT